MVIFLIVLVVGFAFELGKKALKITSKQLELVFIDIDKAHEDSFVNRTNSSIFGFILTIFSALYKKTFFYKITTIFKYLYFILTKLGFLPGFLLPSRPDTSNEPTFPDGTRLTDAPQDIQHDYLSHLNDNVIIDGETRYIQVVEYQADIDTARQAHDTNLNTIQHADGDLQFLEAMVNQVPADQAGPLNTMAEAIRTLQDRATQANDRGEEK